MSDKTTEMQFVSNTYILHVRKGMNFHFNVEIDRPGKRRNHGGSIVNTCIMSKGRGCIYTLSMRCSSSYTVKI
jgi:hypothetical protein